MSLDELAEKNGQDLLCFHSTSQHDPEMIAAYGPVAAGLCRAGFADDEIVAVICAAENFVLGAALGTGTPDLAANAQDGIEPDLRRALEAAPAGKALARQAFHLGVSALVDGLRARLSERVSD